MEKEQSRTKSDRKVTARSGVFESECLFKRKELLEMSVEAAAASATYPRAKVVSHVKPTNHKPRRPQSV